MNFVRSNTALSFLLALVLGISMAVMIQCKIKDNTERAYFDHLAQYIRVQRTGFNEDSIILDALHLTHRLLAARSEVFSTPLPNTPETNSGTLTGDLMTADGACDSYADVLCETLTTLGFESRIAQMKVNGRFGGHIITETLTSSGWVVLDASSDQSFTTPQGRLASFKEVSANWNYYKQQTGKNYNPDYTYSDVRYTNWDKIPVIMPLIRKALVLTIGSSRTKAISIIPKVLRRYAIYYHLLLSSFLALAATLLLKLFIRVRKRRPFGYSSTLSPESPELGSFS